MKKKILILTACTIGLLVIIFVIARLTGVLEFRIASTESNRPTIEDGSLFFALKYIKPSRFDFVCYNHHDNGQPSLYIHRLCGMPGDTIEIRNGDLFVNNKSVDDHFTLSHAYLAPKKDYNNIISSIDTSGAYLSNYTDDTIVFIAPDQTVLAKKLDVRRYILPTEYKDNYIPSLYKNEWNQDHFGPVIVPKDRYFVLGDNRYLSNDSRYIGFVPSSDIVSTVLWKK